MEPHNGVYTRLGKSEIHGVGVFEIRFIKKGINPFKNDNTEMVWVERKKVLRLPAIMRKLYQDFGVLKDGYYGVPQNFNQLTPGWYVNNSKNPNLRCGKDYNFFATRDIRVGEELTVDYSTYSED